MPADIKLIGLLEADVDCRVNANGSGIFFGHPIAATGTMRMVTLPHQMQRQSARFGPVNICGGCGQGIAAVVERV